MWVAWTVAGCLGFVLALMASGRLIYMARQRRKVRPPHAALPHARAGHGPGGTACCVCWQARRAAAERPAPVGSRPRRPSLPCRCRHVPLSPAPLSPTTTAGLQAQPGGRPGRCGAVDRAPQAQRLLPARPAPDLGTRLCCGSGGASGQRRLHWRAAAARARPRTVFACTACTVSFHSPLIKSPCACAFTSHVNCAADASHPTLSLAPSFARGARGPAHHLMAPLCRWRRSVVTHRHVTAPPRLLPLPPFIPAARPA